MIVTTHIVTFLNNALKFSYNEMWMWRFVELHSNLKSKSNIPLKRTHLLESRKTNRYEMNRFGETFQIDLTTIYNLSAVWHNIPSGQCFKIYKTDGLKNM